MAVSGKLDVNNLTSNQLMMCEKETLVDFIEQLKEEIENHKNYVSDFEKCIPDHYDIATPNDIESVVDELKEENEELKKDYVDHLGVARLSLESLKAENKKLKEEKEELKEEEKVKKIKRKEWCEKMVDRDLRLTLFAGEIHCYLFGGEPTEMDFHNLDFDAIVNRLKYFKEQMRNLYEENQELIARFENSQLDLDFLKSAKVTVISKE